jgi:hypothetical protein
MVMQKPPKKIKCRRILEVLFLLLAAFVLLQGAFVLLVRAGTFGKLPGYQELKEIQNPMATEVYSADGVLMGTYYIENRQFLEPQKFRKASKMPSLPPRMFVSIVTGALTPGAFSGCCSKVCCSGEKAQAGAAH